MQNNYILYTIYTKAYNAYIKYRIDIINLGL
jgi:hypothetical protein